MFDVLKNTPLVISSSPEATQSFAKKLAPHLKPGDILCLEGDLGSGKTTFSKGLISSLTTLEEEMIQSPTFVYLNIYETPRFSLCHFDLYRIESSDDFQRLGFLDYLDGSHVCLIEWPHKISCLLPKNALHIHLTHVDQTKRTITLSTWKPISCH